jgi:hypothetical protein
MAYRWVFVLKVTYRILMTPGTYHLSPSVPLKNSPFALRSLLLALCSLSCALCSWPYALCLWRFLLLLRLPAGRQEPLRLKIFFTTGIL